MEVSPPRYGRNAAALERNREEKVEMRKKRIFSSNLNLDPLVPHQVRDGPSVSVERRKVRVGGQGDEKDRQWGKKRTRKKKRNSKVHCPHFLPRNGINTRGMNRQGLRKSQGPQGRERERQGPSGLHK